MNKHPILLLALVVIYILTSVLPVARPTQADAAPDRPPTPTDPPSGVLDESREIPYEPPSPGQLPPEVEQARALATMEAVLAKPATKMEALGGSSARFLVRIGWLTTVEDSVCCVTRVRQIRHFSVSANLIRGGKKNA